MAGIMRSWDSAVALVLLGLLFSACATGSQVSPEDDDDDGGFTPTGAGGSNASSNTTTGSTTPNATTSSGSGVTCVEQYPTGSELFLQYVACLVCEACVDNCDGETICGTTQPTGYCDSGQFGELGDPVCQSCIECATQDACSSTANACASNPECIDYDECRMACIATCDTDHTGSTETVAEDECFEMCHGTI